MQKNKTVRQFAQALDVHPNTVYHWIRMGKLPCLKLGSIIRIRPCDEEALFARCEFDAGEEPNPPEGTPPLPMASTRDAYEMGVAA